MPIPQLRRTTLFSSTYLVALLFLSSCAHQHTRVMVRSWAADDYRLENEEGRPPPPETYILYRGEFDSGSIRDDSLLGEESFLDVADYLKESLAKQNYVMAKADDLVDLVIVVHWGQTTVDFETTYVPYQTPDGEIEELEFEQITDYSLRRNALILGTADKVYEDRIFSSYDKERAIAETSDERYYFICIALDAKDLVRRKKTVKWITQFSVDTTGTSYLDALPSMTRIASNYFGKKATELRYEKTHLGEGEVTIGDIEVVSYEDKENKE